MAGFKLNVLSGLRPRVPESLLPQGAATIAQNCDFAYGELRNTRGGYPLKTMGNAPATIYTDDGLSFFSWMTDVDAVRSPLMGDTFNRLYYSGESGVRVTNRLSQQTSGGVPSSSYQVGVPRPTAAPVLAVSQAEDITTSNAALEYRFHWEYGGVKYQEQAISITTLNNTQYQFTPPDKEEATPEMAFAVLRQTAKLLRDDSQVFDLYTQNSSFDSTGGLYSISLSKNNLGTYTVTLTQGIKESDKETRAYIFTQVNVYGEEGPPSDPATITTSPLLPVSVQVSKNQLPDYAPVKELRIYRTSSSTTSTDYYFVGSVSVLDSQTVGFTDNVKAELLNEPMSSLGYYPPSQDLRGLFALPNGILCAWKNNELHFSEAYKPWAWPPAYVKTLTHPVVGAIAYGSGAIVTTTGVPYMVSGVSPDTMTVSKINVNQAGVSKWSMAVVDGAVVYASNDGLVTITGGSASLAPSQKFFTREVWRSLYGQGLSSMKFAVWDGRLVVFSSEGSFTPFMIRFDEADGAMTELPGLVAKCAFTSVLSDQLYYANQSTLIQFNGGEQLNATWQSREMVTPRPVNYGAAQAVCEGAWTVQLYAYVQTTTGFQWQLKSEMALSSGVTNYRLPSGYESDRYRLKLVGTGRFRELRVAQTARELVTL